MLCTNFLHSAMQLYIPTSEGRRGVVLKKKWGTPETRLTLRFLNNLGLHTRCTEIILHCVSVSNQLQQWTNFCTNFSPKKWGSGDASPLSKKVGDAVPACPCPTTPASPPRSQRGSAPLHAHWGHNPKLFFAPPPSTIFWTRHWVVACVVQLACLVACYYSRHISARRNVNRMSILDESAAAAAAAAADNDPSSCTVRECIQGGSK